MIRPPAARKSGGFTLMEILVVLTIIALLGGLSIGAFQVARRNYLLAASAGEIQAILRAARNTSIATSTPSFVVIDPSRRLVEARSFETIGEWSFEGGGDDSSGLARLTQDSAIQGGAPGRLGMALALGSYVDCGRSSRFDVRDGVAVEAWVYHEIATAVPPPPDRGQRRRVRLEPLRETEQKPAHVIVAKKGSFFLGMSPSGALEAAIGSYRARTEAGVVAPCRWVFVSLRYDGDSLEVGADGVRRSLTPLVPATSVSAQAPKAKVPTSIPVTREPLTISSPERPFPGRIDEVSVRGRSEPLAYQYPEHELVVGWKRFIRFDARGHLDPAYHEDGERIVLLELPDRTSSSTTVSVIDYSVTYEEWKERFRKKDEEGKLRVTAPEEDRIEPRHVLEARIEASYPNARKVVIEVDPLGVVR